MIKEYDFILKEGAKYFYSEFGAKRYIYPCYTKSDIATKDFAVKKLGFFFNPYGADELVAIYCKDEAGSLLLWCRDCDLIPIKKIM